MQSNRRDKNSGSFEVLRNEEIKNLLVTSNKLTYHLAGVVASGVVQDVARGPPAGLRWRMS
jgi:hypothetical protein